MNIFADHISMLPLVGKSLTNKSQFKYNWNCYLNLGITIGPCFFDNFFSFYFCWSMQHATILYLLFVHRSFHSCRLMSSAKTLVINILLQL
ncbi:Uncharacterized protein TCM_016260 [Theobroma cacao]|uniref:Uncharacterized protein n=1 Tax=Theobroma cacao TaxID=3641 RepID=A0A061G5T0_THECC|nr:Uncharacterized protein TCM_016260 [Theobroma cacao]